ncbi:MAG: hypothetical protein CVU00_03025 [Bacteroidetes bacterium HGW-Bacteroidetes-17]|jgi:tetratricopeptide (TPR) repeat protein|nr:MAG: hypothetical protein CVU00_03025 [Bacteroidetes bacterium HGW-Bacteroidetes-17]
MQFLNEEEWSQKIKEGNYPEAISIIKKECKNFYTDVYNDTIWKYNFNLAFAYENLASVTINGERVGYLKINKSVLDSAIYYYENAIRISKLNPSGVQVSDAIFLAGIKLSIGEFENAKLILDDLGNRLAVLRYNPLGNNEKSDSTLKNIFSKLRARIKQGIKIPILTRNIGPFGFSAIQIQPSIILVSESATYLSRIRIGYSDLSGKRENILDKQSNDEFNFNKPVLLERKGIFPFDKYITTLEIKDAQLKELKLPLSIYEPTFLKGTAFLSSDQVTLKIVRHPISIILFYSFFIITLFGIISLNKSIKNMKYSSFKRKNFELKFQVIATIVSFIFSLISLFDIKSIFNLYSGFIVMFFVITIYRLTSRYVYLKKKNN